MLTLPFWLYDFILNKVQRFLLTCISDSFEIYQLYKKKKELFILEKLSETKKVYNPEGNTLFWLSVFLPLEMLN